MEHLQEVAYRLVKDMANEAWRMGIVLKDSEATKSRSLNALVWKLAVLLDAEDKLDPKGSGVEEENTYNFKVQIRLRKEMDEEELKDMIEWNLTEDFEHIFTTTPPEGSNHLLNLKVERARK